MTAAAASAFARGLMSVEFSGQRMRSSSPGSTLSVSAAVPVRWFSSTSRACEKESSPRLGTLPCTAAMVRRPDWADVSSGTRSPPTRSAMASRTHPLAVPTSRRRSARKTRARTAPMRATTPDTSGTPPRLARAPTGLSACANATRPQGKPPNGATARSSSVPTQSRANTGTCRRARVQMTAPRRAHAQPAPKRPTIAPSASESANHGTTPTVPSIHARCGMKNAAPKRKPTRKPQRALSRPRATKSTARATKVSGHQPRPGKPASRRSPPPTARSNDVRRRGAWNGTAQA